jgi:hypothetical protein
VLSPPEERWFASKLALISHESPQRADRKEKLRGSLLLLLELLDVEVKLSAFKDVAVEAARLSGAGGNAGVKLVAVELVSHLLLDSAVLLSLNESASDVLASLRAGTCLIGLLDLLLVKLDVVVLKVPLSEGGGVNFDNAVLDEGLGTNELVVGSVVNDIDNSALSGDRLGAPGEDTCINAESAVLLVATTATDLGDLLGAKLGHGGHTSHFELSFFLVDWHATASCSPLVSRIPRNTHSS